MLYTLFIPTATLICIAYFSAVPRLSERLKHHQITGAAGPVQQREVYATILNLAVFTIVGYSTDLLMNSDIVQISGRLPSLGFNLLIEVGWFFVALLVHDLYFYASHRFLHWKPIFKSVHKIHHKSHGVNPWTAFSFHPIEGLIQILIVPILGLVLPMHELTFLIYIFFLLFLSVYGHCGYELRAGKLGVLRIFNTSVHHAQHHKYVHYNYGFSFNLWDRLFKTNHPNYEDAYITLSKDIEQRKVKGLSSKSKPEVH